MTATQSWRLCSRGGKAAIWVGINMVHLCAHYIALISSKQVPRRVGNKQ